MRILKLATPVFAIALTASLSSLSVSAQSPAQDRVGPAAESSSAAPPSANVEVARSVQFATLRGVKAVAMASTELKAVKGLHVHFFVDSNNTQYFGVPGLHLAGDINSGNFTNWYNRGGSDNEDVAPSYEGLCVATGVGKGGITIPEAAVECP